jgi:hypothetical protein
MQDKIKINWKTIEYRLDAPYYLWTSYINFIKKGLTMDYKFWYFLNAKRNKCVGKWWYQERNWFQKFFLDNFK